MSILSKVVGSLNPAVAKSSWESAFIKNIDLGMGANDVKNKPYTKSDLVYICITTTARAISHVPFVIEERVGNKWEPVNPDNKWRQLFKRPNMLHDTYSFFEAILTYLLLDGDSYVIKVPPTFDIPLELIVVKKNCMTPRKNSSGNIEGWRYEVERKMGKGTKIDLGLEDVMRLWFFNPYDPMKGFAPMEAGELSVVSDYKAALYNSLFFDQGASPGGVMSTEGSLTDTQFERLEDQMKQKHTGYQKAHKTLILEGGLKYTQTALNQKDMEYYNYRQFNESRIIQLFGMKKIVISITADLNLATAKEERKSWWQDTNVPLMSMIESACDFCFFNGGDQIRGRFDKSAVPALQEDFHQKVETGNRLFAMGFTGNEINKRLELGFKELPHRDFWYIPSGMVREDLDGGNTNEIEVAPEGELEEEHLLITLGEDGKDLIWEQYMESIIPNENKFEKAVKSVFYKMRKRTLGLLYQKDMSDVNDELYFEESKELKKLTEVLYASSVVGGIESLGILIDWNLNDPRVVEFLSTKLLKIVGVVGTVKEKIRKEMLVGLDEGESIDQIAKRIRNVFNASATRARTIARTEVIGSTNFGRYIGIQESSFKEKEWFTAMDERVRTHPPSQFDHAKMHGRITNTNQAWVVSGESLRYPGDWRGSAGNIINCRCIEIVKE